MTSADAVTRTVWPLTIADLHRTYQRGAVANDGISISILARCTAWSRPTPC
jgi:hypothetical protein